MDRNRSMPLNLSSACRASIVVSMAILVASCATRTFDPAPLESVPFQARAVSQTSGCVTVRAAVTGAEETEAIFGVPLYERGIQPVWIEVDNQTRGNLRFAPVALDRDYFSPIEVAYIHRSGFSKQDRADMERMYHDIAMPRRISAGETHSGFVFTHLESGTKSFSVDLFGSGRNDYQFVFFVDVPGFVSDHAEINFARLYAPEEVRSYNLEGLRKALAELPCCATDASGSAIGLPINMVLIGRGEDVLHALLRGRWYETQRGDDESSLAVSQYWSGRPPDAVLRLRRGTTGERNELRVWLSPMRVDGEPVWLAQVTHYLTGLFKRSFLDPDLDDAGLYLFQNIWYSQGLAQYGFVSTGHDVPYADKRTDFSGARYYTSGYRGVLWLSAEPHSMAEVVELPWHDPPARE